MADLPAEASAQAGGQRGEGYSVPDNFAKKFYYKNKGGTTMKTNSMFFGVMAIVAIAFIVSGCAEIGPAVISPKVYKSSELKMVSANSLATAKNITSIQGQELDAKLAEQWGKLSLQEVENATKAISPKESSIQKMNVNVDDKSMKVIGSVIGEEKTQEVIKKLGEEKKAPPSKEPAETPSTSEQVRESPVSYSVGPDGVAGGVYCLFINDGYWNKSITLTKEGGALDGRSFNFDLPKNGGLKKYRLLPGKYKIRWTREYDNQKYSPPKDEPLIVTYYPKSWDDRTATNYHGRVRLYGN